MLELSDCLEFITEKEVNEMVFKTLFLIVSAVVVIMGGVLVSKAKDTPGRKLPTPQEAVLLTGGISTLVAMWLLLGSM